jgi:hypothetical protein
LAVDYREDKVFLDDAFDVVVAVVIIVIDAVFVVRLDQVTVRFARTMLFYSLGCPHE